MPNTADEILARYYADAAERLRKIILSPPGATDAARVFNRARAAALINQVHQIQAELKRRAVDLAGREISTAIRAGRADADAQAAEAGIRPEGGALRGSFNLIDSKAAVVVARDTAADLSKAVDSMGRVAERILRKTGQLELSESEINRVIAGGIIEGKPREAIRELRDELRRVNEGGIVEVISRNGTPIHFEAGYYAKMVVVTKTRQAVTVARHERLGELGIDLVSIIGKVSNNFCTAFLGQVFSVSGKHPRYPALASLPGGGPPFHPNCSKGTRAYVEALANPARRALSEGLTDANKLLGMDPTRAQRAFKDLQLRQQVTPRYQKLTPIRGPKGRAA